MNTNASIRQWVISHPNQEFTAKQVQEELGIYRGTHVSNELGACLKKRASYMKRAGLELEVVGKAAGGAYIYRAKTIGTNIVEPQNPYIFTMPAQVDLRTVPLAAIFSEIARRTNAN